jgi:polysaccharide biosynthesis/export protein
MLPGGQMAPGGNGMPMGYVAPPSGMYGASASTANMGGLPSVNGQSPAGGFPTSSGFPAPGSSGATGAGGISPGGTGVSNPRFSNLLKGVDQNTLNAVASQLGVSGDQLSNLRNQVASGAISPDQVQQLAARFGALNLSEGQMGAIARTLGLNDEQLGQIRQTLASAKGMQNPLQGPGQSFMQQLPSPNGVMEQTRTGYNWIPSTIEAKFQEVDNPFAVPETPSSQNLVQFGYNFFSTQVSTFAPVQNIPVGNDYVIGPGDEIDILLWGRVNSVLNPTVDRNGMIQVTELGPIQVAGLTFAQAKKLIEDKATKMTGVQVDVTMGQLRTINVTVAGDVNQPGSYTISALSRVSNALVASGGVSKIGSLREIEVRHGNQLVEVEDLYDILLHGDNAADRRLEEGDVIFVPVIGNVVGITGDVKRPAIYELQKGKTENLEAALKLAGGVSAFGYSERVQVERIQNHKRFLALDVNLNQLASRRFTIHDGDVIKIFPVLPGRVNTVVLSGNVRRPGEFQWSRGMRVSDLIRKGEGILPETYLKYALIRRLEGPRKTIHFLQVNLGDALSSPHVGQADIALQPKDELDIYNQDDVKDLPSVAVNGEVRLPGRFVFNPDMKVSDLVYMAGGLKDDAYQDRAVLVRSQVTSAGKAERKHIDIDLHAIINGESSIDVALKPNDELFVRTIQDWQRPAQYVEVTGEVRVPGIYDYYPGMRVSDLLAIAGGPQDDAYLKRAELARTEVINGAQTHHTYMDIDLRPHAKGRNDRNVQLKPNDELLVKAASNYHLPYTVLVSGQVMRPGAYTIREGERLDSLIERCGGFLPHAFVKGIIFQRTSVLAMQQERLNEARQRLEKEAANAALTQAQLASVSNATGGTGANSSATMMVIQNVLAASQNQQAQGRIVINVNSLRDGKQGPDDIVLEDGDHIEVPVIPSSVNVLGEVNYPNSFLRVGSHTVRDYINQAGGFSQYADKDDVMVIKADGSVLTTEGFDSSRRSKLFPALPLISGGLMDAKLDVGDTVYVPENLRGFENIQMAKDITSIIANSAQGLAVIALLATRL